MIPNWYDLLHVFCDIDDHYIHCITTTADRWWSYYTSINLDHLALRSHGSTVYGTMKTQDPVPICFFPHHHKDENDEFMEDGTKIGVRHLYMGKSQVTKTKKNTKKPQNTRMCWGIYKLHLFKGWKNLNPGKMVHPVTEPTIGHPLG